MTDDVRVVVDETAITGLARDAETRELLADVGGGLAAAESAYAPHRTGGGAGSIRATPVLEPGGWSVHVGWDQLHAYMIFPEGGTRYQPAQRFAERALDRYTRL